MNHTSIASTDDRGPIKALGELREKLQAALSIIDDVPSASKRQQSPWDPVGEQAVRSILKARENRDKFFPVDLFADPAWDMLLELYAAELGQRRMSVSELCIGARVPATTALRWIATLENNGLLMRSNDPFDGRRVFLRLSNEGSRAMTAYFATVRPPLLERTRV